MVELNINNTTYQMPSNWNEVNLKKFIDIQTIISNTNSELKKTVEIISVLSGCPIKILYTINLDDIGQININWINEPIEKSVDNIKVIDGIEFGVVKDMKKLTLGEYVDLDHYSKEVNDNIHYLLAILMRPVLTKDGDLYIIEDYDGEIEERAELFLEKMDITQLTSVSDFFLNTANGFLKNMKSSLQ